jgi:hypothetical protein
LEAPAYLLGDGKLPAKRFGTSVSRVDLSSLAQVAAVSVRENSAGNLRIA